MPCASAYTPASASAIRGASVVTFTLEARHTLCSRFGYSYEQLAQVLRGLGVRVVRCEDTPGGALDREARVLLTRLSRGETPFFSHACPRWKTAAQIHNPALMRFFAPPVPIAFSGVAVVGCPVRKVEISANQPEIKVLTVREVSSLLIQHGARAAYPAPPSIGQDDCRLSMLIDHARAFYGEMGEPVLFAPSAIAGVEEASFRLQGRWLKAARVRCLTSETAQMLDLVSTEGKYAVVELLSCWGSC